MLKEIEDKISLVKNDMLKRFPDCSYTIHVLLWDDNTYRIDCKYGSEKTNKIHVSDYYNEQLNYYDYDFPIGMMMVDIKIRQFTAGHYTKKENCLELSKKCQNIKEFRKLYNRAYKVSLQNNWLCEFFDTSGMKKPPKYWFDKEKCKLVAGECINREDFHIKYTSAYNYSNKNKWLDEFFPKK